MPHLHYIFLPPLAIFALWWLTGGGRFRKGRGAGRGEYPQKVYFGAAAAAALVLGFVLGKNPNPVHAVMEIVRGGGGLAILFFSALAVAGNKLICGWGCPFGALQEILYAAPVFRKVKENQLPFFLTMPIRTAVVGLFGVALLGWGTDLYALIDPFELFDGKAARSSAILAAVLLLALSLAVYRPFCQLLCPFGWYSWFLERLSLLGIRVNHRTCIRCNACARACPLEAARGRLLNSPVPADCFSCARCMRVCPTGAIDYGPRWRKNKT